MSNQQLPAINQNNNQGTSIVPSRLVQSMSAEWAKVLPKCCTPERFARVALSCINKNPTLATALQTSQGQTSLLSAFMTCAEFGLEPNGRQAHLIPYRDNRNGGYQVQLIFDYKGIVELVRRSGLAKRIYASGVCENDIFEYNKGEIITHTIRFNKPRGEAYAFYAEVTFNDGSVQSDVMSKFEIDAIRNRSKSANNGPWVTDYSEMAKKTVFKRLSKWLPLSPEVKDAIDYDNDNEFGDIREFIAEQRQANSRFSMIGGSEVRSLNAALTQKKSNEDDIPYNDAPPVSDANAGASNNNDAVPRNDSSTQVCPLGKALIAAKAPVTVSDVMEYCEATGEPYRPDAMCKDVKGIVQDVLNWQDSARTQK